MLSHMSLLEMGSPSFRKPDKGMGSHDHDVKFEDTADRLPYLHVSIERLDHRLSYMCTYKYRPCSLTLLNMLG